MDLDARLTLGGELRSAAVARRFVARTLTPLLGREDVETAMLLTSELVTNSTLHTHSGCELHLRGTPGALQIRVSDDDRRAHVQRVTVSDELAAGRGLRLLEVLCRRWGVESGARGKTVWCELRVKG